MSLHGRCGFFYISLKKQWEINKKNARNEDMFTPGKVV